METGAPSSPRFTAGPTTTACRTRWMTSSRRPYPPQLFRSQEAPWTMVYNAAPWMNLLRARSARDAGSDADPRTATGCAGTRWPSHRRPWSRRQRRGRADCSPGDHPGAHRRVAASGRYHCPVCRIHQHLSGTPGRDGLAGRSAATGPMAHHRTHSRQQHRAAAGTPPWPAWGDGWAAHLAGGHHAARAGVSGRTAPGLAAAGEDRYLPGHQPAQFVLLPAYRSSWASPDRRDRRALVRGAARAGGGDGIGGAGCHRSGRDLLALSDWLVDLSIRDLVRALNMHRGLRIADFGIERLEVIQSAIRNPQSEILAWVC